MNFTGNMNIIWKHLTTAGYTPEGTAGLMGNLYAESGCNPMLVERLCLKRLREAGQVYDDASYTAGVDSGAISRSAFLSPLGKHYGYGLAQWTTSARKAALYDLCKQRRVSISDLRTQLDYLCMELRESFQKVNRVLRVTRSIKEASDIVLLRFEAPADAQAQCGKRMSYSQEIYNHYYYKEGTHTMISNCGHDEHGRYSGGQAGDQTGKEWAEIPWYNRPWTHIIRFREPRQRQYIAALAREAAGNNLIGYDQNERTTFWKELKVSGYHPAQIRKPCEADCSAGVAAICKAVGYLIGDEKMQQISPDMYTGNEVAVLRRAGAEILTEAKYLRSDKYLYAGDILLCERHHTAICITDGEKVQTPYYTVGWHEDEKGWWYADTTKTYYADRWALIKGRWYLFGSDGYMLTGIQERDGRLYYLTETGPCKGACCRTDESGAIMVWDV